MVYRAELVGEQIVFVVEQDLENKREREVLRLYTWESATGVPLEWVPLGYFDSLCGRNGVSRIS